MKNINKLFLLALATTPLLFSCNPGGGNSDKEPEVVKTYTVTLNANGGYFSDKSTTKTIKECTTITTADLEEPSKENAAFKNWYLNSSCTKSVTFPYTLTSNTTLYAGWNEYPSGDFTPSYTSSVTYTEPVEGSNTYTFEVDVPKNNETPSITLEGSLNNAQICIDFTKGMKATNNEINLVLNNFMIKSTDSLVPLSIKKSNNLLINVISNENTSNFIFDAGTSESATHDGDGAIDSKSNLKFSGKGSLYVNDKDNYPGYSKGIDCSKNITIDNTTISSYGYDMSIRGKRSITINDSNVTAYSKTGSALKTSDEDVQDGVRCGDININGNTYLKCATAQHGVSASRNVNVTSNENGDPKIDIYTNTYANSYIKISSPILDEEDMYIQMPSSLSTYANQDNYRFAVRFDNNDDLWDNATLKKFHKTGGEGPQPRHSNEGPSQGVEGYYFGLDKPKSATSYEIFLFDKNHDTNLSDVGQYVAKTASSSFPSSGDTAKISSISGTTISCSSTFGEYDAMVDKSNNSEKASYGCKGLTAGNQININNAELNIRSKDDAIHGKYGKLFPADSTAGFQREVGTGNVYINGDRTVIYIESADDAIHGTNLNIGDEGCPKITIGISYEGIEAGVINYKNGITSVYARDDGMNAAYIGNITDTSLTINVTGGYLDIGTDDGDTDGIDSNNTYTQTGGIVVSRASSNSTMSTGLDVDTSATISDSGVFIALGAQPEAAKENKLSSSRNGNASYSFNKNCTYKINDTYEFITKLSYSKYYYYIGSSASIPTIS